MTMIDPNVFRQTYRPLTSQEQADMKELKAKAMDLYLFICRLGDSREIALAKTKLEEAVMWATKDITR
jgi:hypothetical protein